jgi:hypothetical protein
MALAELTAKSRRLYRSRRCAARVFQGGLGEAWRGAFRLVGWFGLAGRGFRGRGRGRPGCHGRHETERNHDPYGTVVGDIKSSES